MNRHVRQPFRPPTDAALSYKIKQARELLKDKDGFFANERKATSDFLELGISRSSELWPLVRIALTEITAKSYVGGRPPNPSYEPDVQGEDCWEFCWDSAHFGKRMFLRFMVMDDSMYFHSSLHESTKD